MKYNLRKIRLYSTRPREVDRRLIREHGEGGPLNVSVHTGTRPHVTVPRGPCTCTMSMSRVRDPPDVIVERGPLLTNMGTIGHNAPHYLLASSQLNEPNVSHSIIGLSTVSGWDKIGPVTSDYGR
ncbi:hypothetical protein EVAR_49838_1 [Eumeta japonica]|uniref:Uncharacterized protein n=1 Tax=Eumeta variegata TaxID=151549 RepID=A0A4C1Z0E6_EUMVA|nr:hypothetical protein EVAR_49838_1 [Eumeta japonica]